MVALIVGLLGCVSALALSGVSLQQGVSEKPTSQNAVGASNDVPANALPYVVKSTVGSDVTLTFQYGDQPAGTEGTDWWVIADSYTSAAPDWTKSGATKAFFDSSFYQYKPTQMARWFEGLSSLTAIEGFENCDASAVISTLRMFFGCSNLRELDLSTFNSTTLKGTSAMFSACSSLKTLKLNSLDTSNL